MPFGGDALGLLVESHEGRPTKIEGNPDHPASLGATDAFTQAALLSLYDPDRSQSIRHGRGEASRVGTWDQFRRELWARLETHKENRGRGLALLTGAITSPSTLALLDQLLASMPLARWYRHEPL